MHRAIAWFARHGVAANLLMVVLILGGGLSLFSMKREFLPEVAADTVSITVSYLGASPAEVEEAIVIRVEERIQDLESVERVGSQASEGIGAIQVLLRPDANPQKALDEIKARIDAIDSFPAEAEKPVVQLVERRWEVISVAISGRGDEDTLKRLGRRVERELTDLPGVTQASLIAARPYEISIELSEVVLRRHGLSFDEVVEAVRQSSLNLPGGSLKTGGGEILLRTEAQAYTGRDFEEIVLMSRRDGTELRLGDVAKVVDGFVETDHRIRFDGESAVLVQVYRVGDQDALAIAETVKAYVEDARRWMPEGLTLTTWQDETVYLRDRLETLVTNGRAGLVLVFLTLTLFLRLRLAFWVVLGIPVAFLATFWAMPVLDLSINVVSLFAFILVLGIVVDDAIVIGENIYTHYQRGKPPLQAAIEGAQELAVPVIFAVVTTVAAFSPLITVEGRISSFGSSIGWVVILCLAFSLLEVLLILPAHLSHLRTKRSWPGPLKEGAAASRRSLRDRVEGVFEKLREDAYRPLVRRATEWRYLTLSLGLTAFLLTLGLVAGGWVRFLYLPAVEGDNVVALLTMPQGTLAETTSEYLRQLEDAAWEVNEEIRRETGSPVIRHLLSSMGEQPYRSRQSARTTGRGKTYIGEHLSEINLELVPSVERPVTANEVTRRWRRRAGAVAGAEELVFSANMISTAKPITVELSGDRVASLEAVADKVKDALAGYDGVFDIADSFRTGKEEIGLGLTPEGKMAGVTRGQLARQVRQGFYGAEVQRLQRSQEEIKVMVRYPANRRRSLADLKDMRIRTPNGGEIPFSVAADLSLERGYATIERVNRRRVVNVTADLDSKVANANEIVKTLGTNVLPQLVHQYPGVGFSFEGEQDEQRKSLNSLGTGLALALALIFGLLAIPLRSYSQPLIVMSVVPFGLAGAVWGHLIMGLDLSMLSVFGMVALTGVVVNDSLVLVDFMNRARRGGQGLAEAVTNAATGRLRPILLTSFTTFLGLTPLLLEKSVQAQFLIPMACSLAFGVLFASGVTLLLVPAAYWVLEDLKALVGLRPAPVEDPAEPRPMSLVSRRSDAETKPDSLHSAG